MSYAPRRRAYEIAATSGASTSLLRAFRVVLDTIEYGVLFVDEDLRVRMHNRAFREIWKVPGDFLAKKPSLRELMEYVRQHGHVYNVADKDWHGYVQARLDAIRSGDTTPIESQRTDGAVIQHQSTALPDGGYILTYFDVTAGKLAEQALRNSEQRLVDALESTSDGFALFDKDDRLAVCNSRYRELYSQLADVLVLGTPFETIIRAVAERNLVRDALGRVDEWVEKRMAQHRNPTVPILQPQADGRWLQIDERKTDEGGTVIVFTDITEIKRGEQELADANRMQGVVLNELHAVLDAVNYGILFLDADLNVRLHNRAYREIWQMPETLFAGNPSLRDLLAFTRKTGLFGVPDEQWEAFVDSRVEAVKKGEFPQPELTLTNGTVLQFQCFKLPDGGRMLTYFDITERYRAEQKLRDSEERYALVTEAAEEGIYEWSLATQELYLSPRLGEFLKFKPGELGTDERPWNDQIHPEDLPHYLSSLKRHLEGQETEWECEYRFSDKAGKYHWILDHGATVRNEQGKVVRLVGAIRDITERKEASQALRNSEERFKHFAGIAADWFWEIGPDLRFTYISDRHEEISGAKAEEVIGRTPMERLSGHVASEENLKRYFASLQAHEPFEFEYEWSRADGTVRHLRNVGKPIFDKNGVFHGYRGVGQDITERKRTLEALRGSEERYALAMQAINEGVYEWNIDTNEIYYSPGVQALFALSPKELKTPQDWLDRVHRDDRQTFKDAFIKHFKGETKRFVCEYRFHAGDGTLRWARQHGLALRNEHGRAYRMIGSTGDITALRQSEQQLKQKTAILETTLESMDQGISMVDENLRVIAFNRKMLELLELPPEKFKLGYRVEEEYRYNAERGEYGEGDVEEQVRERLARAARFEPYHEERVRPNGVVLDVWRSRLPGGGFVTTYKDITERKRAEQALQEQTDFIRLNQVITAAANAATSVEDSLKTAIDEICAHTRWPVGHVYMFDADTGELAPTALWHLDDPQRFEAFRNVTDVTRFASGIGLPGRVLASGEPQWIEDVTEDPSFARAKQADAIGIKGAFAFPVLIGKEVAAVLELFSDQPAAPNQSLLDVVRQVGTQLGRVIERQRAEQQLRESEERFRAVAQSASDGIISIDSCGFVVAWNRGAEAMFGYTEDEMMGKSLKSIMPEEYRERHADALERIAFGGERHLQGQPLEVHGLRKDGERFPVELSISTWTIGREPFHTGIIRDITERKRAEQALRESEERYAVATQVATEGIYEWDVVRNRLYLSERAKEIFAFQAVGEPTAEVWNSRVHPDDFSLYRKAIVDHFKGRTDHVECEYRFHVLGGEYIWVLDRGIAVRNEAGRAIRLIGALSDITTRKSVEIELRQAKEQAEAATHTKSTFLANMSHELRTPLNAIIGFARLVMRRSKDVLPAKQFENLEKIRSSADHLLSLINDILDLSKIEAGRMDIRLSTVTVGSLVDTCLRTVEPLLQDETVQLIKQVESDLPTIVVDQEKLKQILMNLLSNAVKFTEKGSIKVTASRQGHALVITVADTGIGIPEYALQQVFDEFRQVDDSRTRQRGGTGLGLSISRHLARLMGGDVTVESTVGVGSTFSLSVPLRLPEQNTAPPVIPSRFS